MPGSLAAEMVAGDEVQRGARFRLVVVVPLGAVPAAAGGDLLRRQAEEEEILLAGFLRHLDGGAVARAQSQRPIHHELHVGGAAGLVAGGRDLIGDIAGGNQPLRQGHAVVRQEDHLQPPGHRRVAVDRLRQVVDEFDDQLGEPIGRRRLAREEEGARRRRELGVRAHPVVEHDDAQRVQQLALVFMDALHLAVEDRVGIDGLAGGGLQPVGEADLGLALGLADAGLEVAVVGQRRQVPQLRRDRSSSPSPIASVMAAGEQADWPSAASAAA